MEVIETYANGNELINGLRKQQPDVLLTDLQMPGELYGLELIKYIRTQYPQLPILVLSGQESVYNVRDIMAQGCKGYLLKNTADQDMLIEAIESVFNGNVYLDASLKEELFKDLLNIGNRKTGMDYMLTQRQVEIIDLLSKGLSSPQIADKLYISVRTVDSHRHRIMQKLDVNNVTNLINKAKELHLI